MFLIVEIGCFGFRQDRYSLMKNKKTDILDSRIKKVLIELPHYTFSHSSTEKSQHFVGRVQVLRKLRKLIESTIDKTGVYLVTGNRGVGKTSLVSQVISQTSLQRNSEFFRGLRYFFVPLLFAALTQFCLQWFKIPSGLDPMGKVIFWSIVGTLLLTSSGLICYYNDYILKNTEHKWHKRIWHYVKSTCNAYVLLPNYQNQYNRWLFFLNTIFIVSIVQFAFFIPYFTPVLVLIIFTPIIFLLKFCISKNRRYEEKHLIQDCSRLNFFWRSFFESIENFAKSSKRVYLRINFGHKLKDEKDILRLITRTLYTEYSKFRSSFWRMFYWRITAFGFLLLFAILFNNIVQKQEFYDNVKGTPLYQVSSQILLGVKDSTKFDELNKERLYIAFSEFSVFSPSEKFLLAVDQIIFEVSRRVLNVPLYLIAGKERHFKNANFIFPLNYLFWLSFFSIYLFFVLIFRTDWFSRNIIVTHRSIKQRLKRLSSDITHSTERESSLYVGGINSVGFLGAKHKKIRSVADAREIEKKLQNILNDIQRIPIFMGRPDFVIVFDELDKVEPDEIVTQEGTTRTKASMFSIDTARERQTEILTILSNMKYFLSTANAKFIFIAGREMYDIYLADVSERTNYIGSIFNVVIYVPSFLTDHSEFGKSHKMGMTVLTEEFVCRKLIPHDYQIKEAYDLKEYRKYLENNVFTKCEDKKDCELCKKRCENYHKIQKTIAFLQQFIIYLAHVSKGSPKKIMQLFESFIRMCEPADVDYEKNLVVQRYDRSRTFLVFNYYQQYTIGIVAYLITPIFNRLSESNIKEHSDKLVVSTLRFVDFLFKFHKHSFSWKHLDISPEMLEVNRSPELKSVMTDILNYLTKVHINKSAFSLCDYRFDSLIANEIYVMTKTDETFSALFSFSLDETLSQKKFFEDLLENEEKKYQNKIHFQEKDSPQFIDSISSLQVTLGDLHFYDDNLEEAGVYYKDAVQILRNQKQLKEASYETMTLEQLYIYVRNMLRLGMIYEKREQYDSAYLTYGELCKRIIRERNIAIPELRSGIAVRRISENEVAFVKAPTLGDEKIKRYNDNIGWPWINKEMPVDKDIAKPQPLTFKNLSPDTNDMLFKKITFEGLRLFYLPFIAKLQILEKSHVGGIALNHLEQLEKEFEHLTFVTDHEEAKILEAEFFSRVADILYYKNLDLKSKKEKNIKDDDDKKGERGKPNRLKEKIDKFFHTVNRFGDDVCNLLGKRYEKRENDDDFKEKIENHSCTACYYYHKALCRLLNIKENGKIKLDKDVTLTEILTESINQISDKCNVKFCTTLARTLSDWGNVFFSCDKVEKCKDDEYPMCYLYNDAMDNNTSKWEYPENCCGCKPGKCNITLCKNKLGDVLTKYVDCVDSRTDEKYKTYLIPRFEKSKCKPLSKFEIALAMYTISMNSYHKATLYKRAAFQIYKMLSLFRTYKIYNYINLAEDNRYVDNLSKKAINYLWAAGENLNILELYERKEIFDKDTIGKCVPLQNILVDSDICNIRLIAKELKFKAMLKHKKNDEKITQFQKYYSMYITSNYGINYNVVARIYQLRLKAIVNYHVFRTLISRYVNNPKASIAPKKDIDSIFNGNYADQKIKDIFGVYLDIKDVKEVNDKIKIKILEKLIAESIFCFKEIIRLTKTMGASYLFNHIFMAVKHKKLSDWIRLYEMWKKIRESNAEYEKVSRIDKDDYIGREYNEHLSGFYDNRQALLHYLKCLETHREGRAYHDVINEMCFIKDDYNDRNDHFNNAEERHHVVNGRIDKAIKELKEQYRDSKLYVPDYYFEN